MSLHPKPLEPSYWKLVWLGTNEIQKGGIHYQNLIHFWTVWRGFFTFYRATKKTKKYLRRFLDVLTESFRVHFAVVAATTSQLPNDHHHYQRCHCCCCRHHRRCRRRLVEREVVDENSRFLKWIRTLVFIIRSSIGEEMITSVVVVVKPILKKFAWLEPE